MRQTERTLKKLRRRRLRHIILNTVAVIVILTGIVWLANNFWRYWHYEITNDACVDQYITPINIRVAGYIDSIGFDEHQAVRAGDTLLILDRAEFEIRLSDARAALAEALASLSTFEAMLNSSKNTIKVAEASIDENRAHLWKLAKDEKRYAELLDERSVSLDQYEQIKTQGDVTRAKDEVLIRQKSSAELAVIEIQEKIKSAQAIVDRRKSDLAMRELELSYAVVRAPYDGHVARRTLGVGQLVQAGQVLTYIARDEAKWVTANYKESQIANIFIGQRVRITVDALPDRQFDGTVSTISTATGSKYSLIPIDNSAGNFVKVQQRIPVRIELQNLSKEDRELLRAGMMVETQAELR